MTRVSLHGNPSNLLTIPAIFNTLSIIIVSVIVKKKFFEQNADPHLSNYTISLTFLFLSTRFK
ncbi:hypothetical protein BsIDN1_11770 [Bacillus safensis]|uniref:Uncharacterized protein n=1 Tax=Bacillus safensis TaxID=561879 RepID=A0A5S9M6L4_BACIA|nr:hypothetical protein BsIDN1_11770 [Bacillus safensis]